jgi:hypothetical protein
MKFPNLETMITYGVYTVRELERFSKGLLPKRKIVVLNDCEKCAYVHTGDTCNNCGYQTC